MRRSRISGTPAVIFDREEFLIACNSAYAALHCEPGVGTRFNVFLPIAPAELLEASSDRPIALPAA